MQKFMQDLWKATESDDLKDTINYALVNEIIHQEMKIPSQLLRARYWQDHETYC